MTDVKNTNDCLETIKLFVENSVKMMVDFSDEVSVDSITSTKCLIFQIRTSKKDYGKVIGKGGKTINALRAICGAMKNTKFPDDRRSIILELVEEK